MELTENITAQNDWEVDPLHETQPALIFLITMMPIGVFGNVTVLYIYGFRLRKSPLNILIFLLAIYDSLSCSLGIPLEIISILYTRDYPNRILCKMDKFMIFFTCISSELALLIISLERYNKVCRFNKYQFKLRHAKMSTILINITAILISIPPILYFDRIDHKELSFCAYIVPYSKLQHYFIGLLILNIIILIVMSVLYVLVRRKAKQRFREKSISLRKNDPKDFRRTFSEKMRRSRHINYIIASITILFVISFIPSLLLGITYPLFADIKLSVPVERLRQIIMRLWILNSSLNPVVYGMLNARFRNEFLKILRELFNINFFKSTSTTDSTLEDS